MNKYILYIFSLFCAVPSLLHAQANCGSAVALTPGTQQCGTSVANGGTIPNGGGAPTNPCNSLYNDGEYWFSFTGTGTTLTLDLTNITDTYAGLFVFDACGAGAGCVASITNGFSTGNMTLGTPALTAGQVYYVAIINWGTPNTTSFCLDATVGGGGGGGTANQEPCDAQALTVGATCSYTSSTTTGASNSSLTTTTALPSCANFNGGDVWFTVTVPASGHLIFDSQTGVVTDGGMSIYRGADCNNLLELDCDDDSSINGFMPMIEQTALIPGETIWVRFWEYGNDNPGTFDICVYDGGGVTTGPCTGGVGGETCADVNPFCTDNVYCFTAQTGTTAEVGNDYGCLFTQPNPTWYYFEISQNGDLVFDITATSDVDFAVWGPYANLAAAQANCGTLPAPIDCSYSGSPTEQSNIPGVILGEVYILVVTNFAGVVQDISINTAAGNTATTDCDIVNPPACDAEAGGW